jgi:flagellum-specific peptidoglycan hydrolase FlgJ
MILLVITEFVLAFYPHAKEAERLTGVPAEIILTQAAVESSWGRKAPFNNYFGISGKGFTHKTIEYHPSPNVKYPHIYSITKHGNTYRYVVVKHFKNYPTPMHSFLDFATLIKNCYPKSYHYRCTPFLYFKHLKGYATSSNAFTLHMKVHKIISKKVHEIKLSEGTSVCDGLRF